MAVPVRPRPGRTGGRDEFRWARAGESGRCSAAEQFLSPPTELSEIDCTPVPRYGAGGFAMSLKLQLDGEAWSVVLGELAQALGRDGPPVRLCLIGSAACLLGGMDGRTSADLDIWKPASDFD